MKKTKIIPLTSVLEMQECECGHVVSVDQVHLDDDGVATCDACVAEIVAYRKKFRPILFSTPMVQALVESRKTMTRRTKGLEKINEKPDDWTFDEFSDGIDMEFYFINKKSGEMASVKFPFCAVGSGLYVRENWKLAGWDFIEGEVILKFADNTEHVFYQNIQNVYDWIMREIGKLQKKDIVKYIENEERMEFTGKHQPFSPNIHLPKWGSRIWLEVVGVRVERLHDISSRDICDEGVRYPVNNGNPVFKIGNDNSAWSFLPDAPNFTEYELLFAHWAELWCEINGRQSWDENPWVWVIEFKQVDKPE